MKGRQLKIEEEKTRKLGGKKKQKTMNVLSL